MHALLAAFDPDTLAAFNIFAIAGAVVALALVCAGVMARRKDHKASHFYFIAAGISGGLAILLIFLAFALGK